MFLFLFRTTRRGTHQVGRLSRLFLRCPPSGSRCGVGDLLSSSDRSTKLFGRLAGQHPPGCFAAGRLPRRLLGSRHPLLHPRWRLRIRENWTSSLAFAVEGKKQNCFKFRQKLPLDKITREFAEKSNIGFFPFSSIMMRLVSRSSRPRCVDRRVATNHVRMPPLAPIACCPCSSSPGCHVTCQALAGASVRGSSELVRVSWSMNNVRPSYVQEWLIQIASSAAAPSDYRTRRRLCWRGLDEQSSRSQQLLECIASLCGRGRQVPASEHIAWRVLTFCRAFSQFLSDLISTSCDPTTAHQ